MALVLADGCACGWGRGGRGLGLSGEGRLHALILLSPAPLICLQGALLSLLADRKLNIQGCHKPWSGDPTPMTTAMPQSSRLCG